MSDETAETLDFAWPQAGGRSEIVKALAAEADRLIAEAEHVAFQAGADSVTEDDAYARGVADMAAKVEAVLAERNREADTIDSLDRKRYNAGWKRGTQGVVDAVRAALASEEGAR